MELIKKLLFLMLGSILFIGCASGDYYTQYDVNNDDVLDQGEFISAYNTNDNYYNWDEDGDNLLDQDEWDLGMNNYYRPFDYNQYGTFDDWDYNNDNLVDDNEYLEGTYDMWDEDNDGFIDDNEFNSWSEYGMM